MNPVIYALSKALGVGVALGAGGATLLPFENRHARGPVFILLTVTTVALRAFAWYLGLGAAVGAGIGIVFSMYVKTNDTSAESIVGGAAFGGAIGYLIELGLLGML